MADRRRRRRATSTEDSDELSEGSEDEQPVEKTSDLLSQESAEEVPEKVVGESEYESAEEEDEVGPDAEKVDDSSSLNVVDEEGGEEEAADVSALGEFEGDAQVSNNGDEDDVDEEDEEEEEEEWKDGEREQGDGEESQMQQGKEKPLDDDEDRTNPQYIPKKGGFYEHDDRLAAMEEEIADDASTTSSKKPKKKLWKDEGKWQHDRFKEDEQNPKARDELVAIYGYDIRDEDNAPRARRRRRYGRGPSKYTRKWDDEDAYGKLIARFPEHGVGRSRGFPRGRGRGRGGFDNREDEFEGEYYNNEDEKASVANAENKNEGEEWHREEFPPLKAPMPQRDNRRDRPFASGQRAPRDRGGRLRSRGPGREGWSGEDGRPANNRGGRRDRQNPAQYASDYNSVAAVTKSFEKVAIKDVAREQRLGSENATKETKDVVALANQQHERRQATIPPRLQEAANATAIRTKRYSSQRQRTAQETSAATSPTSMAGNSLNTSSADYQPTQAQAVGMPAQYFDPGFLPPVFTDNPVKPVTQQPGAQMLGQAYQGYPPAYQEPYGQTVIPPPYIAPSGMNYGPPPATYTQYPFQQFPGPHPPVSQPHEIFRGGVAYYTTQAQQPVRATHYKRPRAAIPIVAPPEIDGRPRNLNVGDSKDQLELSLDENAALEQIVEG